MTKMNAEIKAQLLAIGSVDVDELLLSRPSASTAGPGTGLKSIFFKSGGHRVRLEINKESPLKIKNANDDFVILKDNKELARGELEPILAHCPEQAYITLSEQCIYDCKFCSVPKLQGKIKTLEEVITIVENSNFHEKARFYRNDVPDGEGSLRSPWGRYGGSPEKHG